MRKQINSIGIIGYGAFAQLIEKVFSEKFPEIVLKFSSPQNSVDNKKFFQFEDVCRCDLVIPAVPISSFDISIRSIARFIPKDSVLLDVCSVKIWPKKVMLERLSREYQMICTHPMFGPESFKNNKSSIKGFKIVVENLTADNVIYQQIIEFFKESLELSVVEMSADEHDRKAASFHFITMFEALMLKEMELERSSIETESAKKMFEFIDRMGNDHQILIDMYKYNPYCEEVLHTLEVKFKKYRNMVREGLNQSSYLCRNVSD